LTQIGDMSHRVIIAKPALTTDHQGGHVETWTTVATVWASIEPVSKGQQVFFSEQLQLRVTHKIVIRYRTDIAISQRITEGTTEYRVRACTAQKGGQHFTEILAEEGAGVYTG